METEDQYLIGAGLRRARRGREMTLREVAHAAGVTESFLSQVERGVASPSIASVQRIARALGQDGSPVAGAPEELLFVQSAETGTAEPVEDYSVAVVNRGTPGFVVSPDGTLHVLDMYREVIEAHAKDVAGAEAEHRRIADETAARLRAAGREVQAAVRTGDAAGEILAAIAESGADLVVIGSRGRTGIARLVMGSVARNVLHGSGASVLIVHEPKP